MGKWRKPSTAPRDGTIIDALFERRGRRAIATQAAFDIEGYKRLLVDPAPPASAQWIKDSEEDALRQFREDPSYGFRPIGDSDEDLELGRFVGWRPRP